MRWFEGMRCYHRDVRAWTRAWLPCAASDTSELALSSTGGSVQCKASVAGVGRRRGASGIKTTRQRFHRVMSPDIGSARRKCGYGGSTIVDIAVHARVRSTLKVPSPSALAQIVTLRVSGTAIII